MLRSFALSTILALGIVGGASAADQIRIGVEGNYPPFSRIAPDGKLEGFDIDFANALCTELKADCTLVQQEWDGMIPALNANKFDMIIASMTITDKRKEMVDFSDPYYDVPSRWIAKEGSVTDTSPEGLAGKTIIVLRNSPRANYIKATYTQSEVLEVDKESNVYLELAAGRGDIAFGSSVVSGEAFLKTPEGEGYAQIGETVDVPGDSGVGVAIRKNEGELVQKVNAAIDTLIANGTYDQLQSKYFDFSIAPK